MGEELKKTVIIAEAGVNHNGSLDMALRLVDAVVDSGADMVKFQTFSASEVVSENAPKARYQKLATGAEESQFEMIQKLELDKDVHLDLLEYCRKRGIGFLSTPFDEASADLLTDVLKLETIKIGSGEITNGPLLLHIARKGCNVILSTGMSTLGEIEDALGVLAFGFIAGDEKPSRTAFREAYFSQKGRETLAKKVTLLHCTTEYPAPFEEVNLRAMETIRQAFGLPVGYSDHTEGIEVPIAAVAMGACIIEKHFTLDRNLPGPDHKASIEPEELARMVSSIRNVERSIGSCQKVPGIRERENISIVRKSLVAAVDISKGDVFTEDMITCKRPGLGVSPMFYWDILGRRAAKDYNKDEVLED